MRKTLTSMLVAFSLIGSMAATAQADTYPFGDRTEPQQELSPPGGG